MQLRADVTTKSDQRDKYDPSKIIALRTQSSSCEQFANFLSNYTPRSTIRRYSIVLRSSTHGRHDWRRFPTAPRARRRASESGRTARRTRPPPRGSLAPGCFSHAVAFIATVPQGGQPSNRRLLDRVKRCLRHS